MTRVGRENSVAFEHSKRKSVGPRFLFYREGWICNGVNLQGVNKGEEVV